MLALNKYTLASEQQSTWELLFHPFTLTGNNNSHMDCCSEVGCYGCIGGMKWNWTAWELELNGSWSFPGVIGLALTTRRADICGDDWTEELKYAVLKYPVCLGNMSISASLKKTDGDSEKKKKRDICKDRSTNLSLQSTPILRYKTWGTWYCWNYTNVNSSLVPFGSIHIRFNTSCKELPSVYLEHIGNTGRTWKKSMEIFLYSMKYITKLEIV